MRVRPESGLATPLFLFSPAGLYLRRLALELLGFFCIRRGLLLQF
jgi:hypothetical protein